MDNALVGMERVEKRRFDRFDGATESCLVVYGAFGS
jgi:hypothetical protein